MLDDASVKQLLVKPERGFAPIVGFASKVPLLHLKSLAASSGKFCTKKSVLHQKLGQEKAAGRERVVTRGRGACRPSVLLPPPVTASYHRKVTSVTFCRKDRAGGAGLRGAQGSRPAIAGAGCSLGNAAPARNGRILAPGGGGDTILQHQQFARALAKRAGAMGFEETDTVRDLYRKSA